MKLIIPDKITVMGVPWEIQQETAPHDGRMLFCGLTNPDNRRITLDNDLSPVAMTSVFFHELVHAIMVSQGIFCGDSVEHSENFAQTTGNVLYELVKQIREWDEISGTIDCATVQAKAPAFIETHSGNMRANRPQHSSIEFTFNNVKTPEIPDILMKAIEEAGLKKYITVKGDTP